MSKTAKIVPFKKIFKPPIFFVFLFLLSLALVFKLITSASAYTTVRLGIVGDSSADEYRADDARGKGTPWQETTLNWTELLQKHRKFDLGQWATRAEPRRTGFDYNWARSGAQARDVITSGAHTGMAQQITAGQVDIVYFTIGGNDFAYYRDGAGIYNGTIAGAALTNKINAVVADITTAADTMLAADPNIKIILGTVPDMGNIPLWQSQFPDPVKRQKVTDAINTTNNQIIAMAESRPRLIVFDQTVLVNTIMSQIDSNGDYNIAGEKITFLTNGDEPHHGVISDNIHAGTVFTGVVANEIIKKINEVLQTDVPIFTDQEIIINAGIYTGLTQTTFNIQTGSDDVFQEGSTFNSSGPAVNIGGDGNYFAGLRFTNVTIPQGTQISDAHIEIYSPSSQWITIKYEIYAENIGNSLSFSSSDRPSNRTNTTVKAPHYSNISWPANSWIKLTPVRQAVQEIVDRSDWASGNALSIILHGTGSQFGRKSARSFEGGSANAARLVILTNQALPSFSPTPIPSSTPTQEPTPTPIPTVTPTATPTPIPTPTPVSKTIQIISKPNNATQIYTIFDGIVENDSGSVEVTSSRFTYSTGWTFSPSAGVSNSAFRYSTTADKTVNFTTTASSLSIMTARHSQIGSFEVYVDGVLKLTFNGFSLTQEFLNVSVPLN